MKLGDVFDLFEIFFKVGIEHGYEYYDTGKINELTRILLASGDRRQARQGKQLTTWTHRTRGSVSWEAAADALVRDRAATSPQQRRPARVPSAGKMSSPEQQKYNR